MKTILALALLFGLQQVMADTSASEPTMEKERSPSYRQSKQLWAQSYLYAKAPEIVVEKWLGEEPEMEGKFVLIEFWATWCSACRGAQPLMNALHEKFGNELVIIGISDEPEEKVFPYINENKIGYYMAIDSQTRMKDQLGVWGIPHVIIVEPNGYVIWEGFPLLDGYQLTDKTIQKILEIGESLSEN